jgi:predicted negative regulator of RcsB-dependent stress response
MDDENFDAHEQSERARTLFQRYGSAVITGILAAVAILWGFRGWEAGKAREMYRAQAAYAEFEKLVEQKDDAKIAQMGAQIRLTHANTTYAALASMTEAKFMIETGKLDAAEAPLKYAIDQGKSAEVKDLAKLRLARLYTAKNKAQDAITTLGSVSNTGFKAQIEEIRGDAYVMLSKPTEARAAYAAALTATDLADANRNTLQQKLDNLAQAKS